MGWIYLILILGLVGCGNANNSPFPRETASYTSKDLTLTLYSDASYSFSGDYNDQGYFSLAPDDKTYYFESKSGGKQFSCVESDQGSEATFSCQGNVSLSSTLTFERQ